jgi:hypothetical protein
MGDLSVEQGESTRGIHAMEVPAPLVPSEDEDRSYRPPEFEVIPLDCEITAYAPDGDGPLL